MENEMESMQDIQVSLTFSELQCLDSEDVASCVSKQTALQICNQSLKDLSAKTAEVLSIWLRKLLKAYILEAECCIDIFKCCYEWFQRLVSNKEKNVLTFINLCLIPYRKTSWGRRIWMPLPI